jgi:transcriptional regulator with XRE-family HTH domain
MEMNIGERIAYFRKERRYTVNRLANMAGISQSYLRDIELGNNSNPSVEVLDCLCGALGITLKEFFNVEEDKPFRKETLQKEISKLTPAQQKNLYVFLKSIQG